MKMNGCINWTLAGLFFILFVNAVGADDKDEQLLDSLSADNVVKSKRPFCNAFTGCGKKRSNYDNSVERQEVGEWVTIRLPIFVYRALIRVAAHEIRNVIEQTSTTDNLPPIDAITGHDYSSYPSTRKLPIRKRYDS